MSRVDSSSHTPAMFRPPANQAMRVLDRGLFQKSIPLAAAHVLENNQISQCRSRLSRDLLQVERIAVVRPDPSDQGSAQGRKALLLHPEIRPDDSQTWSPTLHALVEERRVSILPYELKLKYDDWTYFDIMTAILPQTEQEDLPTGFSVAGHVAHLNLRSQFLPYRRLIAEVLLDKNPAVRTVINKTDEVGSQNEYRTFQYELLAGDPSLSVEVKEQNCIFRFNYSKVYWNSRLNTEHERLVGKFESGQAVCDVMAGIGPFAVPAGKKGVIVWANDLNPDSYSCLVDAISINKVTDFVQPFNEDGRAFIRRSAQELLNQDRKVDVTPRPRKVSRSAPPKPPAEPTFVTQPKIFDHYVMNLPASATTFLDAFIGLYRGREALFSPHSATKLPMVHVYCFSTKSDNNEPEKAKICEELSQRLEHPMSLGQNELEIWDVRDVAPKKRMFCATFRLPAEVAFR